MAITNWKVAVLLVSFQDSTATHRRTTAFYNNMFINKGTGGLVDYWEDVSFQAINFTGSQVFDWKVYPGTVAKFIADTAESKRGGKCKLAMDLFPTVDFRNFNSVIVIPDADVQDAGATGVGGSFTLKSGTQTTQYTANIAATLSNVDRLGQSAADANFFAHEMGHNFGLPHSNGVEEGLGVTWEGPWEYCDPWDVMGGVDKFGRDYAIPGTTFTRHGIGLQAFHLHRLGWLADIRVKKLTALPAGTPAGTADTPILLEPLYNLDTPLGFPAARINFTDADTGDAQAYWVELRLNTKWDRNAPGPALLIRRVIGELSYLIIADRAGKRYGWQSGEAFIDERNNIRISIDNVVTTGTARADLRLGSFVNLTAALGNLGNDIQGAGIALSQLNAGGQPELAVFSVENLPQENKGTCRIALNMSNEGVPGPLGAENLLPDWGHWENQKADISILKVPTPLKALATTVVVWADNPGGANQAYFRVGTDLSASGATTWTGRIEIPRKMADRTQGVGVALVQLDSTNTNPDIVAAFATLPAMGKPWLFYRVAKNLATNGTVGAWSDPIDLPKFPGHHLSGIGIAIADVRNTGKRDMVLFVMDKTSGQNRGYYAIGQDMDSTGKVLGGWTDWVSVPGNFGTNCRDVSIELTNQMSGTPNAWSMLIFHTEKASSTSPCTGHVRLMKRIKVK